MVTRVAIVVSHPIQHFCPQYKSWSELQGVETMVYFASRRGLDPYHDVHFDKVIKWDGVTMDFAHEFLDGTRTGSGADAVDFAKADERLTRWQPHIVVIYGYAQALQRWAIGWAIRSGKRVAMIGDSEMRSRRPWTRKLAKYLWLRRHLRDVDVFLTVGDANEQYYRYYGAPDRKFVRSCFPIDRSRFEAGLRDRAEVRRRLRAKHGVSERQTVVLMVGKLVSWKRQRDLVSFSNMVQSTRQDITVILAGSGPDASFLHAQARTIGPKGVVFAGFVNAKDLVDYYLASDIYAHCAEVEPHSLAISEAIFAGLPIVLSDRCGSYGPSDDLRPGRNGFVYACGDVDALAKSLLRLIDDVVLRQRMGQESEEIGRANQALAHGRGLAAAVELLGTEERGSGGH